MDVLDPLAAYSPAEYRQGVFCWKNLLAETGRLRFEKVAGKGLAVEARLKWNQATQAYDAQGKAPGLPYISLADVDNDGLLDVLGVGPASPGWAPRAEYVSGRFWRNQGGFQFRDVTEAAGLSALNWLYRDWFKFIDAPLPVARGAAGVGPLERRPYFADAVFGDFNNDGWLDLVGLDRHESPNLETRALMFQNQLKGIGQKYGLGGAVDGEGGYAWGGAYGTQFWIDRQNDLFAIFMVQTQRYRSPAFNDFKRLATAAVTEGERNPADDF